MCGSIKYLLYTNLAVLDRESHDKVANEIHTNPIALIDRLDYGTVGH